MSDKKTVMITGAGGYFAWTLIHELKRKNRLSYHSYDIGPENYSR